MTRVTVAQGSGSRIQHPVKERHEQPTVGVRQDTAVGLCQSAFRLRCILGCERAKQRTAQVPCRAHLAHQRVRYRRRQPAQAVLVSRGLLQDRLPAVHAEAGPGRELALAVGALARQC